MIRFAFKYAAEAARRETGLARVFSAGIAAVTGGQFSHVEIWYDGPQNAAKCFSAREPDGTGFADGSPGNLPCIDLSDPKLWEIVNVPYPAIATLLIGGCDAADYAWFQGRAGRRYNFMGIAGIGGETALEALRNVVHFQTTAGFTDPHDDFSSQCAFEFLQDRRGKWLGFLASNFIAPSGFGKGDGRYGLYELVTWKQTIQEAAHA